LKEKTKNSRGLLFLGEKEESKVVFRKAAKKYTKPKVQAKTPEPED